jgi:lysophospholipase L1-like esterase
MYIRPGAVSAETLSDVAPGTPVNVSGKHIGAVPASRLHAFGKDFYLEKSLSELRSQTKEQWQLRIEGQLFSSGVHLNVTGYDELKSFIQQELGDWIPQEVKSDV